MHWLLGRALSLLDLFLLSFTTVIAMRLLGRIYAIIAFATIILVHQDEQLLVWMILFALLAIVSTRAAPAGWPRTLAAWARNLMLAALLVTAVPFAITQLRFALYPQLADPGGTVIEQGTAVALRARAMEPAAPAPSANFVPPPELQEVVVTGAKKQAELSSSISISQERFAPGTLVQAGPGVPHWHYVAYQFSWSGPVDVAQTVNFLILSPWLTGIWRVLGVALLAALLARLMRGDLGRTPPGIDGSPRVRPPHRLCFWYSPVQCFALRVMLPARQTGIC